MAFSEKHDWTLDGPHASFHVTPTQVRCFFRRNLQPPGAVHWVAAPGVDRMTTFTGSGLPFASPQQALQGTTNRGTVRLDPRNECTITLHEIPNAFRDTTGRILVPPTVFVGYHLAGHAQPTAQAVPLLPPLKYRDIVHRCKGPLCYAGAWENLPIRTQETVLLQSAWDPRERSAVFDFGLKPPM
jgi:hypothetical protein